MKEKRVRNLRRPSWSESNSFIDPVNQRSYKMLHKMLKWRRYTYILHAPKWRHARIWPPLYHLMQHLIRSLVVWGVIDMIRSTKILNGILVRKMAFQTAEKYAADHKWKDGMAGKSWTSCFVRRHPEINAIRDALSDSDPISPGSDGGSVVFASTPQTQPSPVVPPVAAAPSPVQASVPRKSDFPPTTGLPLSNGPLAGLAGSASPVQVPPGAANAGGGPAPPAPSPAPAALPPPSLPPPYPATPMQVSRDFLFCYGN
ncbi:ESX-1 secretion-associated protein EspK-like isoform X2 [Aedes albopictus]|uniref:HTH CENPB-type domain-containing protein n=1 Tax=Aedes albopictus TaxID=7160 RepID=A0ABM1YTS7_AEDAL